MKIKPGVENSSLPGTNSGGLERIAVAELQDDPRNPRICAEPESSRAVEFVKRYSDRPLPIMIDRANRILVGGVFVDAARKLKLRSLLVVRQHGLDDVDTLMFSVAATKLLTLGSWDSGRLDAAVREFEKSIPNFSAGLIGFAPGELDRIIGSAGSDADADRLPAKCVQAVSSIGQIWFAGNHRIGCGDCTSPEAIANLVVDNEPAAAVVDPPFGCVVNGFVSKRGKHREFVEASGEKSPEELRLFFGRLCIGLATVLKSGGLVYLFIDWRSLGILQQVGEEVFGSLVQFCVWAKNRAGMGSFYRSQHELVLVFAKPGAPHANHIQLGKFGRDRSNVWNFPSAASSRRGREKDMLKSHPTPKSVEMISEILLDSTARGESVLDTCLGSGTTLIAAERTQRTCFGMDLDPAYVDLAVRRWQDWTGQNAIDAVSGRTFNEMAASLMPMEAGDE